MNIFKNIPEDYVAHKIINNVYGFDPMDRGWFKNKDSLGYSVNQIAANLVNYHAFIEFCPEFKEKYNDFLQKVRHRKKRAFDMADRAIQALERMDIDDRTGYDECVDEFIIVFSKQYHGEPHEPDRIYTAYLRKSGNCWCFNW